MGFISRWFIGSFKGKRQKAEGRRRWFRQTSLVLLFGLTLGLCMLLSPGVAQPVRIDIALNSSGDSAAEIRFPVSQSLDPVQRGRELYTAGRFAEAAQVWQQAAAAFEQQGDAVNRAMALSNLSLAYQQLGQWEQATTAITTSLEILKRHHSQPVLAQALNTQGGLYLSTGKPEAALESWEQAAAIYQAIADRDGMVRSQINQVQALKALGLYRRALSLMMEVEQTLRNQPDSSIKAAGLRALGHALRSVGDLSQSRVVLQQSLAIAERLGSTADTSDALFSLGNTTRAQQDVSGALEFYERAAATAVSPITRVQADLNRLSLLVEHEDFAPIEPLVRRIESQLADLPPSHAGVYARIHFAQSLVRLGSSKAFNAQNPTSPIAPLLTLQNGAQIVATAIQHSRSLRDPRAESYSVGILGRVYERNGQWVEAQTMSQQALLLAQSIHAQDIAYRWQWQLGRVLKAQNQEQAAIAAYSQAIDTLQSLRSDLVAINTDVQFSFRESVEPVYRQLVELLVHPAATESQTQANLARARTVIESLQLAELDNFFQEACLQAQPVQIDKVDPQAAIIYPILLQDQLEVILSIPGKPLRHYHTRLNQAQLRQAVLQMRQSINPLAVPRQRDRMLRQGYDWLIRPAEADLSQNNIKTLVFVPDGILRNLPMAALYDGSQYLIEKYNIALTPGLQLLDPQPLQRQDLRVLTGGLTESRQGFPPLPGVEIELQKINAEVPSQLLLNQDLTNMRLENKLETTPFNVVHLATHGQFSSNADETFILTWDDRLKVRDFSDLLRNRAQNDTTPLELLVLSACQTASGDERAALGLAGVAVRSGARSTVATLWSVSDEAAAALMVRFYQELTQPGMTKAEALRRAQVSLLKQEKFRQPFYWSPFVLIGNWVAIWK
jgi:CHAT domain-containing protein/uncharacterized protein HemY